MHTINFLIRISQNRRVVEEELPWADLYSESRGTSWFDWVSVYVTFSSQAVMLMLLRSQTTPLAFTLILSSFLIAFRLFSQIKLYNLHYRSDPVNSPHATFVSTELDFSPLEAPSATYRIFCWLGYQFSVSWRFLFNFKPPAPRTVDGARVERVQQLSVWTPGELEMHLFAVYSPAHAFLWMATTGSNWIVMFTIMAIIGIQVRPFFLLLYMWAFFSWIHKQTHLLTFSYEALLKDKTIIAAEVMHEYDEKVISSKYLRLSLLTGHLLSM